MPYLWAVLDVTKYSDSCTGDCSNCPDYLKGIINLRGTIILVIDLRARFHFDEPMNPENCVIVVVAIGDKKYGLVDNYHRRSFCGGFI